MVMLRTVLVFSVYPTIILLFKYCMMSGLSVLSLGLFYSVTLSTYLMSKITKMNNCTYKIQNENNGGLEDV